MHKNIEFEVPTWSQIYRMLMHIADKIRQDSFKPDIIVGVSRGGWPPARVLSDLLENPNLANVKVEFYVNIAETKEEPTLTQPVSVKVAGKRVLVVDEVADTGKSLQLIKEYLQKEGAAEVRIAAVYLKPWSVIKPDYYARETSRWIVFPWEIKETLRRIIQKHKEENRKPEKVIEELVKAGLSRRLVEKFLKEIAEEEP
ncbi:MAG: phosphoribosyltransferase [Candidatus Bathyarchaeia archaeon]|nr:phosphoribosyltransferase [Candidatus Bathyarchaeota archaeon]